MRDDKAGPGGLDYFPCRYGGSEMLFRGPKRPVDGDFIAFLGGAQTYGKFIAQPFPAALEATLGLPGVNLGWPNAGIDAFLGDPAVQQVAASARVAVIQVLGAQNMSNRFYSVHPRRNDRFLQASVQMRHVYPEVDFTEFTFTRHMLGALGDRSAERLAQLREELRIAWVARMRLLMRQIRVPVILLWFADHPPDSAAQAEALPDVQALARDPLFVTQAMLEALRGDVAALVTCVPSPAALAEGTGGMIFGAAEARAAAEYLPAAAHRQVAASLEGPLRAVLGR